MLFIQELRVILTDMLIKSFSYVAVLALAVSNVSYSNDADYGGKTRVIDQSKLEWLIDRYKKQDVRGGSTKGPEVQLDLAPSEYFQKLQNKEISKKEMDRLAILSMSGEYKVSFEFTEMYGAKAKYKIDSPYKSWGTEAVIILQNSENHISLQHILVMHTIDENNKILGPFVQKHWRQDWSYEDKKILDYKPVRTWVNSQTKAIKGKWSQTVYQVDDTPRYESYGTWVHNKGASRWISQTTPRPLPRREFSVRNDYSLLLGINKITIMPWGWVMEEVNDKIGEENTFVGAEYGIARYQKISDYDFSSAYKYWNSTKDYWKHVRESWNWVIENNKIFCLKKLVDQKPTFVHYFTLAENFKKTQDINSSKKDVTNITDKFLETKCTYFE